MKRRLLIIIVMILIGASVYATQVRLTGQVAFSGPHTAVFEDLGNGTGNVLGGAGWEVAFRHIGFGGSALVGFRDHYNDVPVFDWDLRGYMSYHLFGTRAFLDPFFQAGVGTAGRLDISGSGNVPTDPGNVDGLMVGFYPYIGGGVGLLLREGFYISGQFNWRPTSTGIPWASIQAYPVDTFEVVFTLGIALGDVR